MSYGNRSIPMGNSNFLRIKKGESADIHILTRDENIQEKRVYYDGEKYQEVPERGVMGDVKIETRWKIKVLDRSDNKVKDFEFGPNIFIGIQGVAKVLEEDGQTIHDVDLRIARVSENPVRYNVVQRRLAAPIPQAVLDEAEVPF